MSVPVIDRNRGFSMIEVLMVLAIAGMLMLVAIPNFQDFMKDRQATQVINQLLRAVYFTRTQAIEKAAHVTLCQSSDGIACGGEWGDGYVVFLDPNRNATVDAGEEILLHRGRFENDSQVTWHGSGGIDSHLRMTPQGYTDNIFGTFIYCPSGDDAHFSRGLTINRAGRAYPS